MKKLNKVFTAQGNLPVSTFFQIFFSLLLFFVSCGQEEPSPDHRFTDTDLLIESAIADSLFPGAVLLIGNSESIQYLKAYGYAAIYGRDGGVLRHSEEMTTGHLFDIASLTKIYATTYGLMLLHSRGLLDVDTPVSSYLPQFNTEDKESITIRHLLTHSSGLIQWFPTYYTSTNSKERLEFIAGQNLIGHPGENRRYSDPGFMVLGDIIEVISGKTLDQFLNKEIYSVIGLGNTHFNPRTDIIPGIAATSHGNPFEKRMVYDDNFGYTIDVDPESWNGWRDYVLRGEVNDGNAYHTHKGIAGHAGLFSTAEELYRLTIFLLTGGQHEGHQIFTPDTINLFLTPDRFGHGLGFMMDTRSLNVSEVPAGSFGHTGFTGTNFIVIPEQNLILILLTNRQHYGVDENGNYPDLRELRSRLVDIFLSLES